MEKKARLLTGLMGSLAQNSWFSDIGIDKLYVPSTVCFAHFFPDWTLKSKMSQIYCFMLTIVDCHHQSFK